MDSIQSLKKIRPKNNPAKKIKSAIVRLGATLELLLVLLFWALIFKRQEEFGGMAISQISVYILIGNLIALMTSFILEKIFTHDFSEHDSKIFILKPLQYCFRALAQGFTKYIFPFLFLAAADILILRFFIENLELNLAINNILLIMLMILLAFLTEFFIAYLLYFFIFWTIEHKEAYIFAMRLKKIISGGYFPLSILPLAGLKISLLLPFAYSFYVPTQLLLGKIGFSQGVLGIYIQIFWLLFLYAAIKIAWQIKNKKIIRKK